MKPDPPYAGDNIRYIKSPDGCRVSTRQLKTLAFISGWWLDYRLTQIVQDRTLLLMSDEERSALGHMVKTVRYLQYHGFDKVNALPEADKGCIRLIVRNWVSLNKYRLDNAWRDKHKEWTFTDKAEIRDTAYRLRILGYLLHHDFKPPKGQVNP